MKRVLKPYNQVIRYRILSWVGHIFRMKDSRIFFKNFKVKRTGILYADRITLKEISVNMRNWVGSTEDRSYWRAVMKAVPNSKVRVYNLSK